jgi:hypothetical protein
MSPLGRILLCLLAASGPVIAADADKLDRQSTPPASTADTAKADGQQGFVPGGVAQSFVIPKNTCESGTSIQKLLTAKPARPARSGKPRDKTK